MKRTMTLLMLLIVSSLCLGISLDDSIVMAKQGNKELLKAKEDIYKADAQYKDVRGYLLPQLTLQGAYSLNKTYLPDSAIPPAFDFTTGLDATADDNDNYLANAMNGVVNSLIPSSPQKEGSLAMQLKFQQVLFMGAKLINGVKAVDRYRSIQKLRYDLAENNIVVSTTELFYQCLLAGKLVQVQQDALDTANKHLARVELFFKEGQVSEFDLLRARLEVAKLKPQLVQSQNNYDLALSAFRKQIGTEDQTIIPEGEFILPQEMNITEEEAISSALANRLELRLASINTEVQKIRYNAEKGNYLPNVALTADASLFTAADEYGIESDDFGTKYSIGIGFQFPLFTGLQNSSKRAYAKHDHILAQIQEQDYKELIGLEVKQNYQKYTYALENYRVQTENIKMAERNVQLAQIRYENQVGIQLEVFDSLVMLAGMKLEYYNAIYQVISAERNLVKSMGNKL